MAFASKVLGAELTTQEKKVFKQRFDIIDTGKDGFITLEELKRLVKECDDDLELPGDDLDAQLADSDVRFIEEFHREEYNFEEFLNVLRFIRKRREFMLYRVTAIQRYVVAAEREMAEAEARREKARKAPKVQTASAEEIKAKNKEQLLHFMMEGAPPPAPHKDDGEDFPDQPKVEEEIKEVKQLSVYRVLRQMVNLKELIGQNEWRNVKFSILHKHLMGESFHKLKGAGPSGGGVSFRDLTKYVQETALSDIPEAEIQLILKTADEDASGTIDFKEYLLVMQIIRYRRDFFARHLQDLKSYVETPSVKQAAAHIGIDNLGMSFWR